MTLNENLMRYSIRSWMYFSVYFVEEVSMIRTPQSFSMHFFKLIYAFNEIFVLTIEMAKDTHPKADRFIMKNVLKELYIW